MKRILCVLLVCLMLSGCFFVLPEDSHFGLFDGDDEPTAASTAPAAPIHNTTAPMPTEAATTAPSLPMITVTFQRLTADIKEYALITATDEDGNTVWTVETDRYDMAQLNRVSDIGQSLSQQKYYYVDDGDVVALDLQTGFELWRYTGFNGSPAGPDATFIDAAGTVYLCGFFGPDYFAIDTNGNVLDCISQLHPDYYWAHKLIPGDGVITVCFSGGPEGDMGPEAYKVDVSIEGYPQIINGAES